MFDGLAANTAYNFYQRFAETDDTDASASSLGLAVTTNAASLTGTASIDNMAPRVGDVLNGSLAGSNNTGVLTYVWKVDGTKVGTGASCTVAEADLGKSITLEISSSVQSGKIISAETAAVLKKADAITPDLTDISDHWAEDDIQFVVNRGLLIGTSASIFSPNIPMSRGMFVTALSRLAKADVSVYKQSSFSDVKNDSYYAGPIEWAYKNNIIKGIGNGKFDPDRPITREQMAVIMKNYAKTINFTLPKVYGENTFADSEQISKYAFDAVKLMQMAGILTGKPGNRFDPQGTATRAEVAAVLRRFVELAIIEGIM